MLVPIVVRYDLERIATLLSLPECPYVRFKNVDFKLFKNKIFMCYSIELIFGTLIPRTTKYNVVREASL